MTSRDLELLPALDLRRGAVVRLLRGDDARRTVYGADPLVVLAGYAGAGVACVHLVDLDAALGEPAQRELIERLLAWAAARGGPAVQLGGGMRDAGAIAWALGAGCERVVVGSLVARDPELFRRLAARWPGRLVPAVDVRNGEVRTEGWVEKAGNPLRTVCRELRGVPCPAVLVTDVERDGTRAGPNLELASEVARASGLPALLSGGISTLADLRAARADSAIVGVVVGRALYEHAFSVEEALAVCRGRLSSSLPDISSFSAVTGRAGKGTAASALTGLTCRVIPCLDVAGGRVVKGVRFRDLADQGDPAEAARRYAEQGADEIVFLDVGAAPEGRGTALDWVRRTAASVFIPLSVGGGVRSVGDAERLLRAGADKVAVNTAAVDDPELLSALAARFGSQCVVLSVDARRLPDGAWEVLTHGGRRPTGRGALPWLREGVERGAGEVLLTSIDSDGTRAGYDLALIAAAARAVPVPVIASGGAGHAGHLAEALAAGAAAVLAASIFHQGTTTVAAVKAELAAAGFRTRPVLEEA
jgi:cyclase